VSIKKNILIAESHLSITDKIRKGMNATSISFTCRPAYYTVSGRIESLNNIYTRVSMPRALKIDGIDNPKQKLDDYGDNIISLIHSIHMKKEGFIFLAQDNDTNGNIMASLLYYLLINEGVPEDAIIRVTTLDASKEASLLFDTGEFFPEKQFIEIINRDRQEQYMMNGAMYRTRLGYRNIAALAHIKAISSKDGYMVQRLSTNIAFATYITKYLLGEGGQNV